MSKSDLTTGTVVEPPIARPPAHPTRKPELYTGEPPQSDDGKTRMEFVIQKKCEMEDWDKKNKRFKCQQRLHVIRVKNQVLERDESGFGGQLNYDDKDIRQYVVCPIHGGLPLADNEKGTRFDKWEPGSKL